MAPRDKARIFANTREMLAMAEDGLAAATGTDPRKRRAGLMNLFTYGRSVTMAIQTMKHTDAGFEDWWKPYQEKMAADPLMRYFNTTRTEVLHEGELTVSVETTIGKDGPVDIAALVTELGENAPPNTISTFFGEGRTGGNGWIVRMPDGSEDHVYFDLPAEAGVETVVRLPNPPTHHDGKPLSDTSVATLGEIYVATLRRVVKEFEARFA